MRFKKSRGFPTTNKYLTLADIQAMRRLLKAKVENETKDQRTDLQERITVIESGMRKTEVENKSVDYKEILSNLKANAEEIREDAFKLADSLRTSFAYASINDRLFSQDTNSADLENGLRHLGQSKTNKDTIYAMNNIADILAEGCHEKNLKLSPNKKEVFKTLKTRGFAAVMNPREKKWVVYKIERGNRLISTRDYDKASNANWYQRGNKSPQFVKAMAEVRKMNNEPNSNYETVQDISQFISLKNRFEKKVMMHKEYLRRSNSIEK